MRRRARALPLCLLGAAGWAAAPAAAALPVPPVTLGPGAAEAAVRVEAPVAEVTVFSDRARVRRRGTVTLKAGTAGIGLVRFPDLPGALFLDTVRVSSSGGRVLRVETEPLERERFSIAQAAGLLDQLDAANDRIAELDDRQSADEWELGLLGRLRPAPPVPEDKREGRKNLSADVPSWWKALDFISERDAAARARLAALADEQRAARDRRDRLRADIQKLQRGGFSSRGVAVVAVIDAAQGASQGPTISLELEYFIPGARWKPAYDLQFAPSQGQLRIETAAVVEQATGEDWDHATLLFSTAIPGRGIDLPELLTWTLGERSEMVPRLRPRKPPPVEPSLPASAAALATTAGNSARAQDEALVQRRLAQALGAVNKSGYDDAGAVGRSEPEGEAAPEMLMRKSAPAEPRPKPAPMSSVAPAEPAPMAAPPSAEAADQEAAAPRRRLLKAMPGSMRVTTVQSVSSFSPEVPSMALELFEAPSAAGRPSLADPFLPAVSAGGFDYVYPAPAPASVPSTGKPIRIPLAAQSFRAAVFHQAPPGLDTTAFLRARVRNDGKRPLLRGPATIFSDGELVGVGEIQTTGPGGDIELPLGADQDVRLVRQVVPSTKTTGLIMKSDETTYAVQIQVANYKKQKVTIEIADQVPRSRNEKVEVKMLDAQPAPIAPPDADGVVRWRVDVQPGATATIRLGYRITRPAGWEIDQ